MAPKGADWREGGQGRRKVEEFYHTKGYPKTTVEIFEGTKPTDLGVVYLCNEGKMQRISKVEFEGNTIASDGRHRAASRASGIDMISATAGVHSAR